ncbi:MAG TPA: AarF/UbiB family protein, partial [Spirochaetota bacterium]|nr:AarF/UbiB family protein [Spirochaetota bacterium]
KKAEERQNYQIKFLSSDKDIEVGNEKNLPLDINIIQNIDKDSKYVTQYFGGGLTSEVFKLKIDDKFYALKKKRDTSIVQNIDGQTSFLNEVQRRSDFERLKKENPKIYEGIVDTIYASYKRGIILSKWIEGEEIQKYDADIFEEIFKTLFYMESEGIFEYDMINGNLLLTPDKKVVMYDFGYTYTFDPLTEYNPDGIEVDIFHGAERFETRCFMQHLKDIENNLGIEKTLSLFKEEKKVAAKWYKIKIEKLKEKKAKGYIIDYYKRFVEIWEKSISNKEELLKIYRLESFRSFLLDVYDDVHGKTCNVDTLEKINTVIKISDEDYDFLNNNKGLFWGDEKIGKEELLKKYKEIKKSVIKYQLKDGEDFNLWRTKRIENIKKSYAD